MQHGLIFHELKKNWIVAINLFQNLGWIYIHRTSANKKGSLLTPFLHSKYFKVRLLF